MQLIHRPDPESAFRRMEIPDTGLVLARDRAGGVAVSPVRKGRARARSVAHVVPFVDNHQPQAALVVTPGETRLFVGGQRPVDVYVLAERDEIVVDAVRFYFTARRPLVAAPQERDAACGVCGESTLACVAVVCTSCRAVTHSGAMADGSERPCFSHRGACPGCGTRAEDFDWLPEVDADA